MHDIAKCYLSLFNLIKKITINWWRLKLSAEIFLDNFRPACSGKIHVVINVKFYVVIGLSNWFFVRSDVESGHNVAQCCDLIILPTNLGWNLIKIITTLSINIREDISWKKRRNWISPIALWNDPRTIPETRKHIIDARLSIFFGQIPNIIWFLHVAFLKNTHIFSLARMHASIVIPILLLSFFDLYSFF